MVNACCLFGHWCCGSSGRSQYSQWTTLPGTARQEFNHLDADRSTRQGAFVGFTFGKAHDGIRHGRVVGQPVGGKIRLVVS